ncbi:hypothetical protein [Deinococcus apachensis]|uniref:hypothetical protein n=1 Tax=Deinococcus apachensis TaxID=309886 RepID=UPI000369E558|nr:hypothetical protein [Deinococcus apachensis]
MTPLPDLLCLSHLRWDFVHQRPQHLMTRAARDRRVYSLEEPLQGAQVPHLQVWEDRGVVSLRPHLPTSLSGRAAEARVGELLRAFLWNEDALRPLAWVYSPMSLPLLDGLVRLRLHGPMTSPVQARPELLRANHPDSSPSGEG